jgi:ribose transport system substrate-binding protein
MVKKMKRLTSIILCISMLSALGLSGCSQTSKTSSDSAKTSNGAATTATSDKFKSDSSKEYYMVTFLSGYPFWKNCYKGFQDAAALYGAKTVYTGSTTYDVNASITVLEQIIAKKPAGIAVTCMNATAYIPAINKARAEGIPVVTFDSDSPKSNRIAFIGTQNYQAGVKAAEYIGKKLNGTGVVGVATSMGQTNIKDRSQGFTDTIKSEFPKIKVAQVVDSGSDQVTSATNISNMVKKNPDMNYIFCGLETATVGGEKALQENNMTGKIKIVGFDTDKTTLDSIRSGSVEATISQAPWCEGYWAMNYLYFVGNKLVNPVSDWQTKGYPALPATADSGAVVVTKGNVESYYNS